MERRGVDEHDFPATDMLSREEPSLEGLPLPHTRLEDGVDRGVEVAAISGMGDGAVESAEVGGEGEVVKVMEVRTARGKSNSSEKEWMRALIE